MESTYTDIVELIDEKIEWHQAEVEKLTTMREQLAAGEESEPAEPKKAAAKKTSTSKRTVAKAGTVKAKSNGNAHGGERKQQIIELLSKDMPVMDIARQLGTHPNYVRTVKKNHEAESPRGRRISRAK